MALLKLDSLVDLYTDDLMKENINRLKTFDLYHCLRKATMSSVVKSQDIVTSMPESYLTWIKFCDGGLLFDTSILSSKEHDSEMDLDFDTFEDYNSEESKQELKLPEGYVVFAVRSYGDPICFNVKAKDNKVYHWNVETETFEEVWDSFEDWLTDEIDTGIQLIADDVLEPLDIKLGDE